MDNEASGGERRCAVIYVDAAILMLGWISMHNKATRRSGPEAYLVYVEDTTTTKATQEGAKDSPAFSGGSGRLLSVRRQKEVSLGRMNHCCYMHYRMR